MASQSHNISTALKRKISTNSSDEPEQKKAGEESLLSIDDKFDKGHGFTSMYAHRKGEREDMQDRHLIVNNFQLPIKDIRRSAFFALFDGHGGKSAAEYCVQNFLNKTTKAFEKYCSVQKDDIKCAEKSIKKIFIETYKAVDDDFLNEARKRNPPLKDGTTACTVILIDDCIYSANIGDTKAIVGRYKQETKSLVAMPLTIDHHPQIFEERTRINKAGGNVKDGRVMGVLEVSRSIGDGPFKSHGVICTPDVKKLTLTSDDLFLILACDGLWKVFSSQSALDFVLEKFKASSCNLDDEYLTWVKIIDDLAAAAVLKGSGDNVSIVFVVFGDNIRKIF